MCDLSIGAMAGKAVIEKVFKLIVDRSAKIDKILAEDFKILGRDMVIECPQSLQKYSLTFETNKKFLLPNKKKFKLGTVKRVDIRPIITLKPMFHVITFLDDGFEINLNQLESGETYFMEIEYAIDNPNFIDSLVYKKVAPETPQNGLQDYWLSAQLKNLAALKQNFGYVALRDLDFSVDVSIYQDIKMKVPRIFTEKIETIVKLTQPIGRSETDKLYRKLLQQKRQKYTGDEMKLLKELQELFDSTRFKQFVDITNDFHYSNCMRGGEFYEKLPFPTWPKSMKIISRTDLDFDKPAAEGALVYKKGDFTNEISRIFKN